MDTHTHTHTLWQQGQTGHADPDTSLFSRGQTTRPRSPPSNPSDPFRHCIKLNDGGMVLGKTATLNKGINGSVRVNTCTCTYKYALTDNWIKLLFEFNARRKKKVPSPQQMPSLSAWIKKKIRLQKRSEGRKSSQACFFSATSLFAWDLSLSFLSHSLPLLLSSYSRDPCTAQAQR